MKAGDYVRTECGIAKVKSFETKNKEVINLDKDIMICNMDCYRNCCTISQVIKSSSNIIDLIEEHDILKIEEQKGVYTFCEVEVFREPYEKYTFLGVRIDNRPIARKLYELNIKSIVTHEQFSQMEYRIGE